MAKHYKYVNGKRLIVVNNYDLGSDVVPEEVNLIPDITQADEGKVLMADENGEPKWTSIPSELPTLTGNSGKVLKVNSGATGVEWGEAGGGGSGGNVINLEENSEHALNMKYSDIVDALNEHKQIIVWVNASTWGSEEYPSDILRAFVLACMPSSGFYKVKALMYDVVGDGTAKVLEYVATTEDGYPVFLAG